MDSIHEFTAELLKDEPKNANSVSLYIDTDGDNSALFEVLLTIMTDILKYWYQPPISIQRISQENTIKLVAYFASFGYVIDITSKNILQDLKRPRIDNKRYEHETELINMKFQMIENGILYTVKFKKL